MASLQYVLYMCVPPMVTQGEVRTRADKVRGRHTWIIGVASHVHAGSVHEGARALYSWQQLQQRVAALLLGAHTLILRLTPAVAKNSSSRSNTLEQSMSGVPERSPNRMTAFTCAGSAKSASCPALKAAEGSDLNACPSTHGQILSYLR